MAAIDDGRRICVRDNDTKGWHVLNHNKGVVVVDCSMELFESLERSFIEDSDGGDCPNASDDDVGSVARLSEENVDDDVCQECEPVYRDVFWVRVQERPLGDVRG